MGFNVSNVGEFLVVVMCWLICQYIGYTILEPENILVNHYMSHIVDRLRHRKLSYPEV